MDDQIASSNVCQSVGSDVNCNGRKLEGSKLIKCSDDTHHIIDENVVVNDCIKDGEGKGSGMTIGNEERQRFESQTSFDVLNHGRKSDDGKSGGGNDARIGIIGAGIAGLSAAHHLHMNGYLNVSIMEASQRAGGRIYTHAIHDGSIKLELGAQWIHGQEGNPLFDLASRYRLLSVDEGGQVDDEKSGIYCTQDGQVISQSVVETAINELDRIKDQLSSEQSSLIKHSSVGDYFHQRFQSFIESLNKNHVPKDGSNRDDVQNLRCEKDELTKDEKEDKNGPKDEQQQQVKAPKDDEKDDQIRKKVDDICPVDEAIYWSLFEWYMTFECIDNACRDLTKLSSHGYREWFDCPGPCLVNFKGGYDTIIDTIIDEIPKDWLKFGSKVTKINLITQNGINCVQVTVNDDEVYNFDNVIVTISMGCLKHAIQDGGMFMSKADDAPKDGENETRVSKNEVVPCPGSSLLSQEKIRAINSLGYGTINKIFLIFDFDYWPKDFAVKFVWKKKQQCPQFPSWVRDISGFDLVRGRRDVLLGWIGGHGAEAIETISEEEVSKTCTKLLRTFLPSMSIEEPKEVIVTKWFTNELFRGSYSHRTVEFETMDSGKGHVSNLEVLQEPVFDGKNVPRILFAGEATDREFYSSTHGALRSGIREADRLINYHLNNCN